jgi:MFS family permease
MGGIINNPPFKETFKDPSPSLLGTIVAIYEIGCFVGSLITAVVGERLGRRMSILIGAIIMLGGAGMQAGVSSAGPMIAARVISGLGMVSPPLCMDLMIGFHQFYSPRPPSRSLT